MTEFITAEWEVTINPAKHVIVALPEDIRAKARQLARERHEDKSAEHSRNYQRMDKKNPLREDENGVFMEYAVSLITRAAGGRPLLHVDRIIRPEGDGGIDFKLRDRRTINVMCADKPANLIVWVPSEKSERPLTENDAPLGTGRYRDNPRYKEADIHVLGSVDKAQTRVAIWGWATLDTVTTNRIHVNKPEPPFNRRNYNMPRGTLAPASSLIELVREVQGRCACERTDGSGRYCGACDWR